MWCSRDYSCTCFWDNYRGRGRGKGRDRGRGGIVEPVESQLPIAKKGHDRIVPHNVDVVHEDVQDHVEGNGPALDSPVLLPSIASILFCLYVRTSRGNDLLGNIECHL